ncbi:hypothetical protein Trydic_g3502 [Trypoxylus dichotomus]
MSTAENCPITGEKEEVICYSKLAKEAHPESIQMNAGYAFAVVTDALMTFEDDKLALALQMLKDLERKCSSGMSWMRSVKSRVFGSVDTVPYAEQLENQVILADSYVFAATLTFLQQDISGYFRGGWILRKSYKHYQQVYNEILNLYNEIVGDGHTPLQLLRQNEVSPLLVTETVITSASATANNESNLANTAAVNSSPSTGFISSENTAARSHVLEGSTDIPVEQNEKTTSPSQIQNGYILSPFLNKPLFPPHSISCHENLCSAQKNTSVGDKPLKNGFVKEDKGRKLGTAATAIRPFLKKSTSLHSALDETFESRSSLTTNFSLSYFTSTFNIFISKANTKDIDKETISRLLCAVSFGYGLLQLGISLLPPSILRVTSFLGFGGNRKSGLANLMFSRLGTDMRAPFATLTLLWYHTIVRPFFALDGNNVEAGVEAAARLIEESKEEYGQSALFLFFEGRVKRLNSNIPEAIEAFQASVDNAAQREIKMMSLHEVGWCYLIQLDFIKSESTFTCLKQSSRWSRPFYSYLSIISAGSNNDFQTTNDVNGLRNVFQPVPKGTQLDEFLNRRYKICPLDPEVLQQLDSLFWKLLVFELLYLWNTLPSCTNQHLHIIIDHCKATTQNQCEPMTGLAKLIEGSCLCILRHFNDGIERFRDCLNQRKTLPYNCADAHISAFAQYELGLLLIRNKQTLAEGKKLLQLAAYNYKDYDFEQRLSVRVHAILQRI